MNHIIESSKKEFFDYVVLYGLDKALHDLWELEENNSDTKCTIEFDDGTCYATKEELKNYIEERKRELKL